MKKIEAIIRKSRFEDVKQALLAADIEWFSYYDVRGVGKARQGRIYRGIVYDTSSIERILVSLVVRDKNVERAISAILAGRPDGRNRRRSHIRNPHRRCHTHTHRRTRRHSLVQRRTGKIIPSLRHLTPQRD